MKNTAEQSTRVQDFRNEVNHKKALNDVINHARVNIKIDVEGLEAARTMEHAEPIDCAVKLLKMVRESVARDYLLVGVKEYKDQIDKICKELTGLTEFAKSIEFNELNDSNKLKEFKDKLKKALKNLEEQNFQQVEVNEETSNQAEAKECNESEASQNDQLFDGFEDVAGAEWLDVAALRIQSNRNNTNTPTNLIADATNNTNANPLVLADVNPLEFTGVNSQQPIFSFVAGKDIAGDH